MDRAVAARLARRCALLVAALALAVEPAAAHAGLDSTTDELIWSLNSTLLWVAVPITILVEGILLYTVWRFRSNDEPSPTAENRRLEITWTVATAVILVFVGVASYQVLAHPDVTQTPETAAEKPDDAVVVQLEAHQWYWNVGYPGEDVTLTNLAGTGEEHTFVLPADRPVYLEVTSADVIHALHVPGLGLKQDAMPGQTNVVRTRLTSTGEYQLYCAEYCGAAHAKMLATVRVVPPDEYEAWLDEQRAGGA